MDKKKCDYILYFGSPSCPQCRGLKDSLKKAGAVYEESTEYDKFGVKELPTLVLMSNAHDGHVEGGRRTGFLTVEEIDDFLRYTSVERRLK